MSAPAAPAKKSKTVGKSKPPSHPPYGEMVKAAVSAEQGRGGASRQKIVKYIKANYKVSETAEVQIKMALKRGVKSGELLQTKGTGASGSFKLAKKAPPAPKKKPAEKKPAVKKPAAKKPAAKSPKKKPAAKKQSVKKTPTKKPAASKSPKKPAAKSPKKPAAKAPKKPAAKPAAKKPAAKKPAAKKAPKK